MTDEDCLNCRHLVISEIFLGECYCEKEHYIGVDDYGDYVFNKCDEFEKSLDG